MSNQRPSFAKREREMKLKDKARAKAERRAARRAEPRTGHGPPIAAEEPGMTASSPDAGPDQSASPPSASPPSTSPASAPQIPTRPR
jgi:hypothetical protein